MNRCPAPAHLATFLLLAVFVTSLGCQRDPEPISEPPPKKNPPVAVNPADRPQLPPAELTEHQKSLAAACKYLWSKQGDDGGWHSEKYGLLKSGQAQTPFVLHALLAVPESIYARPQDGVSRALDFIRQSARDDGALGYADVDVLEYPNYATSFALRCLLKAGGPDDADLINRMSQYLLAQQYNEARGFASEDLAYGGWGFGGTQPDGVPGHMDLAHTRRVLDALIEAGAAPAVFDRAQHFLRLVQRHPDDPRPQPAIDHENTPPATPEMFDGGFYFSPVVLAANKALQVDSPDGKYFRSYATTTCDGLLALLAAGIARDDDRVAAAYAWLTANPGLERPGGIPEDHPEPWAEALFYYHLGARAEAYALMGWPEGSRAELLAILAKAQQPDGSFRNEASPLQKEDDPLTATSLAVTAMTHALAGQ